MQLRMPDVNPVPASSQVADAGLALLFREHRRRRISDKEIADHVIVDVAADCRDADLLQRQGREDTPGLSTNSKVFTREKE